MYCFISFYLYFVFSFIAIIYLSFNFCNYRMVITKYLIFMVTYSLRHPHSSQLLSNLYNWSFFFCWCNSCEFVCLCLCKMYLIPLDYSVHINYNTVRPLFILKLFPNFLILLQYMFHLSPYSSIKVTNYIQLFFVVFDYQC